MNTRNSNVLRTGLTILAGLSLAAAANAAPPVPAQNTDSDTPIVVKKAGLADFNSSGQVTAQDYFDFMAAWYAKSKSADIDQSGEVTITDLWKFLNLYLSSVSPGNNA